MFGTPSPKLPGVKGIMRALLQSMRFPQASSVFFVNDKNEIEALPPAGTQFFLRSGTNGLPYNPPAWAVVPMTPGGSDGQVQYNNGGALAGAVNAEYDDSINLLKTVNGASAYYGHVGGTLSQRTRSTGPTFTTGSGEETLIQDFFYANSFTAEGISLFASYSGTWADLAGGDTCCIRVYIGDGATEYKIYDSGFVTPGPGNSFDYNGVINGGAAQAWWKIRVEVTDYDAGNQYAHGEVNFNSEDQVTTGIVCPPVQGYVTGFLGYYGGFGDMYIRVTGESTRPDEIGLWRSKMKFDPQGSQYV